LVRVLTSQQAQRAYNTKVGFLPVRPDVLQAPPFNTDPFYQVLVQGLETGRSFPAIPRWGIVEDRLMHALSNLWEIVLAHPEQNIDAIIVEELDPIVERLDLLLRPA
jgi:multiple sugar transport system substrate-binding protein